MRVAQSVVVSGLALLSSTVIAHPGHDLTQEIAERRDFLSTSKRADLSHCAAKLQARGVEKRNVARRHAAVEKARATSGLSTAIRGIKKRDLATVLATYHNETSFGHTENTDAAILFSSNNSCVLTPEVTQGPYYVSGEYIRRNVIEEQEGVEIVIDYQVIDVDTCDPIPNVYLEMWHCNATGVYSGIVAAGNGEVSDTANINSTFLRGIQPTNADGVAQFESTFPGHYLSRSNHIHLMVHANATVYCNGTLGNEVTSSHVGQAFFDQDLVSAVEATHPYSTNTQELTTNANDSILAEEAASGVDAIHEYTYLGDDVSDGLFVWLSFGINTTLATSINPTTFLYAEGGVANPDAGPPPGAPPPPS
ncbi:Intradiol ring-cleavage dioxygenase [Xylariales sp. AK1849]|nr:Intradiol ring-cleavage dioxygenase [Xylariales sp. AK1849]